MGKTNGLDGHRQNTLRGQREPRLRSSRASADLGGGPTGSKIQREQCSEMDRDVTDGARGLYGGQDGGGMAEH